MHDIPLASGTGQFHSDTSTKNPTPLTSITFNQIIKLAQDPPSVPKLDAQWCIPSTLPTRNFEAQRANGVYWFLWADIDKGSPELEQVERCLDTLECEYLIYSSRSAVVENKKWRIIIPLALQPICAGDWKRYQTVLNNVLINSALIPDTVNTRSAQLCILPNRGEYYDWQYRECNTLVPETWIPYLPPVERVVVRPPSSKTDNPQFDKYLQIARDAGMIIDDLSDGVYTVICPNYTEHSDQTHTEARLTAPNTENRGQGGFSCFHDHCGHLNIGHLYNHVGLAVQVDATSVFTAGEPVSPPDSRAEPPAGILAAREAAESYQGPVRPPGKDASREALNRVERLCADATQATVSQVLEQVAGLSNTNAAACIRQLSDAIDIPRGVLNADLKKIKRKVEQQALINRQVTQGHELEYINDEFHFVRNSGSPIVVSFGRNQLGYRSLAVSKPAQFKETVAHYPSYFCPRRMGEINAGDGWLEWPGKNLHHRIAFEPEKPMIITQHDGTTDLNTYTPPVIDPVVNPVAIQCFMGHIFTYTCGGVQEQYDYFIRWMADLFQNPGIKPQAGLLLAGPIGNGKSIIPLQLGKILGPTYLKVAGAGALSKDFNENQDSKMLIFYDEANERDSSRLRDRITSAEVSINGKGKPEYTVRCYARFILVSNSAVPIDVREGDRRFFMPECHTPPGEPASHERRIYFLPIINEIAQPGFHAALHAMLLSVDLTGWKSESFPSTQRKTDMLDEGKAPIDQWLDECQMGGVWYGGNMVITCGGEIPMLTLVESCALFFKDRGIRESLNSKRVSRVVTQRGFVTSRSNVRVGAVTHRTLKRVPANFIINEVS